MSFIEQSKAKAKAVITNASLPALVKVNESAKNVFIKGTKEYDRNQLMLQNYASDAQKFFNEEHKVNIEINSQKQAEDDAKAEYSATAIEKIDAFFKTAFGSSPAAKAVGKFAIEHIYANGNEDKDFMTTNTSDHRAMTLQAAGLGFTEYNMDLLGRAKNQKDFDFYMQTLHTDKELELSSRFLTSGERLAAGVTGAMADPTYLAYAPVKGVSMLAGLIGGSRTVALVGANSALQYTLSQARDYGVPERTVFDTALDVAFGGIIDSALGLRQLKKIDEFNSQKLLESTTALHTEARDMSNVVHELKPDQFNFSQTYTWSAGKGEAKATRTIDDIKAAREQKVRRTPEEAAAIKAEADIEVAAFKATKANEIAAAIAKSGLSKEEFMKVYDNLGTDVKELTSIIREAGTTSGKAGILNTMKEIQPIIKHIGKVSPSAQAHLEAEVSKILGTAYKPSKIVAKDGVSIAIVKGKKSFESKMKSFNKALSVHVRDAKVKLQKISEKSKVLKPLSDMTGLSVKESKLLASTQKKLDEIFGKINVLSKSAEDEVKMNKLLDEHARLTDIESSLLIKTENFRATRETTVVSYLLRQKELYASMANVMDEVMHEMKTIFNDMLKDGLATRAEREIFTKEASSNMSDILEQTVRIVEKDGDFIIENELKVQFKDGYAMHGGKKLMLASTFLAVLGSSAAMADDGSGASLVNAPLYLIMLGFGIFGLRAIANHGGILNTLQAGAKKVASIEKMAIFTASDKGKALNEAKNSIVDKANMEWLNSIQVVMNNGSELSKSLAQRLGFDAVNPQKILNAMVSRMVLIRDDMRAFRDAEEVNYKAWLLSENIQESRFDKLINAGAETANRERFLDEVTNHREFGNSKSQAVIDQANVLAERMDGTFERAVANKLIGFTDTIKAMNKNYIPRIPKYDDVRAIVSAGGKDNLVEEFSKAIAKARGVELNGITEEELLVIADIRKLADSMVTGYVDVGVRGTNTARVNDIIVAMQKLGYDTEGLDAVQIATTVRTNNDAITRGKFRIPMDFSTFTPFKLADGQEINYSSVFERNSGTLLQTYSSQVNGMISMKRSTRGMTSEKGIVLTDGVDTEFGLEQIINAEANPRVRAVLTTYKDAVLGHPLYDTTTDASRTVSVLRDIAYSRLALTQFAMTSEYTTAVSSMLRNNQAMEQGLGNLRNIIRNIMGQESINTALSDTITKLTGMGSSVSRRETSFKNLEGMYNVVDDAGKSGAEKAASFVKYVSLVASRIMHADDAMKRISGIANTDRLDRFLRGEYEMLANRLERLGIDDEFKSTFANAFERDKNGNLVADFDKNWTEDMKDMYANVMHRMIMTDSPEAIVSSLPHITTTDNAGRLVGFMTSFTAQSFTTKALQGLKRPDMRSAVETSVYFLGTYAGMYGRDIVTGKHKDTDEYYDELMFKTIMMMPLTAPYGMLSMMSDPMATSVVGDSVQQMSKIGNELSE
jgi:hypothetical protein